MRQTGGAVGIVEGPMAPEQSPIHRAAWESAVPLELFTVEAKPMSQDVRARVDRSIEVVRERRRARTLYDARGVVADGTIADLARAGWWGLRADAHHGGAGASFAMLAQALTEMVVADPWVAGLGSTQAALGPISSLEDFGTEDQKDRLLPPLARGERLGAFAITEPRASSDWGRIATTARRDGDRLLLTGEKLFISNAAPGRTVSLLCRLDGRFEMLVVELPWRQDDTFEIVEYGLRAPAHVRNAGLRFRDLPVPAANVLTPRSGDGRTIAYRALNHGRVAVCATAAGMLRQIAGSLIPFVQGRETFGASIGTRELVQRRLGRLAARLVACDAMTAWTASLLDAGYRGELECVTAKVFASEALKEATVDVLLKTHGGRALLEGNLFADAVHDLLAPTVYEGENEILTLGFFASLGRAHGATYLAPITQAARAAGYGSPDFGSLEQLWAARRPLASYVAWIAAHKAHRLRPGADAEVPADAAKLSELAGRVLRGAALEISSMLRRHGPALAARQAAAHEVGARAQRAVVLLVTSQYAAQQEDPLVRDAAICMAMELGHELLGVRPSSRYQRLLTAVGTAVAENRFAPVAKADRPAAPMLERLPAREDRAAAPSPVQPVVAHG